MTEDRTGVRPSPGTVIGSRYPWRAVLGLFAVVAVVLTVVVAVNDRYRPDSGWTSVLHGPSWLDGWFQYDAGWYYHIATQGYFYVPGRQSSIAFFPTYPTGVRGLGALLGDYQVAGSLLAVLAGAASVVLFGRWVWDRLPRPAALTAIAVLMLYPYAFFLYGAMYADSLFLLCAITAFLALERRWFWAAGLLGALATAGRPVGVAVAVGLTVRTLEMLATDRRLAAQHGRSAADDSDTATPSPDAPSPATAPPATPGHVSWRDLVSAVRDVRLRHLGIALSAAGLGAWCLYLWLEFGDPFAFVNVESAPGWNQGVGPRTWFKLVYLGTLVKGPHDVALLLSLQALACLCAALLLRRTWQRFGWGYAAYAFVVLLIPVIGTKDFMGTGRYVLVAFPVMAAAGDFLAGARRSWLRPVVLVVCALLLLTLTSLYGRSVAVS